MKSETQHEAEESLATATGIADNCDPTRFPVDPQLAQASGIIGTGWAILAAVEELEELRQLGNMFPTSSSVQPNPPIIVGCGCAGSEKCLQLQTVSKPVPDRTRGHVALALLAMGAMNVLLVVALVVAVLT